METINIELHLHVLDGLFEAPNISPFDSVGPYEAGIDTIMEELNQKRYVDAIQLTLFLPPDQYEPDLDERVKVGLQRFCDYRIHKNEAEIEKMRRTGRRQIIAALPFMGIALVLSVLFAAIVDRTTGTPWQLLAGIFATLFSVASWIIVWDPIEMLSYGWRPLRIENRFYRCLIQSQVKIICES